MHECEPGHWLDTLMYDAMAQADETCMRGPRRTAGHSDKPWVWPIGEPLEILLRFEGRTVWQSPAARCRPPAAGHPRPHAHASPTVRLATAPRKTTDPDGILDGMTSATGKEAQTYMYAQAASDRADCSLISHARHSKPPRRRSMSQDCPPNN